MKNFVLVLLFTALTACCWGGYGPVLRLGTQEMDGDHLRPFICVGAAYFLVAIVLPAIFLGAMPEKGAWTVTGTVWSIIAGAAGALGALGIILAFSHQGQPIYVMPLVFGVAPLINTFLTMTMAKSYKQATPIFYAGMLLVITGAVCVLVFKPSPAKPAAGVTAPTDAASAGTSAANGATGTAPAQGTPGTPTASKPATGVSGLGLSVANLTLVAAFIALAALSWGAYGPVLHKGQAAMQGSRMRPFMCVGIAYFLIAVLVPALLLEGAHGAFTVMGVIYSLAGGALGAVGALGIIMAFNFGGKPVYVMPLVFGGAPVVNTIVTVAMMKSVGTISPLFYAGLLIVMAGAVTVLIFAPKGPAHPPAKPAPEPAPNPVLPAAPSMTEAAVREAEAAAAAHAPPQQAAAPAQQFSASAQEISAATQQAAAEPQEVAASAQQAAAAAEPLPEKPAAAPQSQNDPPGGDSDDGSGGDPDKALHKVM